MYTSTVSCYVTSTNCLFGNIAYMQRIWKIWITNTLRRMCGDAISHEHLKHIKLNRAMLVHCVYLNKPSPASAATNSWGKESVFLAHTHTHAHKCIVIFMHDTTNREKMILIQRMEYIRVYFEANYWNYFRSIIHR